MHQNNPPLFQSPTQKQLKSHFIVHSSIPSKSLNNHIHKYIQFYHQILLQKTHKQNHHQFLIQKLHKNNSKSSIKSKSISILPNLKLKYQTQCQSVRFQINHQIEIQNNLQKQITQYKKSLGLLKGDIGHLILRNQSQNLLEQKINKVKIVADDQYNKVRIEFSRNKQEQKILRKMQEILKDRLKNVQNLERKSLCKAQERFLELNMKEKILQQKLCQIEKYSGLIVQQVQVKKQKQQNNYRINYIRQFLNGLYTLLQSQQSQLILNSHIHNLTQIQNYFSKLHLQKNPFIQSLNPQQTKNHIQTPFQYTIPDRIIHKYHVLHSKLQTISLIYTELLIKFNNLQTILSQQPQIFLQNHIQLQYPKIQKQLNTKLCKNLKIIYLALHFFQNFGQDTKQNINIYEKIDHINKKSHLKQQFYDQLIGQCVDLEKINENLKHKFQKSYKYSLWTQKYTRTQQSAHLQSQSQNSQDSIEIQTLNSNVSNFKVQNSSNNQQKTEETKPKRIKFLQRIDQNYYQMLKQTLKMQKDHTKKNYDFLSRFKRQKYVNRDAIQKQKRYQSTFSILWSQNQKKTSLLSKNSIDVNKTGIKNITKNLCHSLISLNPNLFIQKGIKVRKRGIRQSLNQNIYNQKHNQIV